MKISPDGTKLAMAHAADKGELFDFDTATGRVSNARVIYEDSHSYGVEFSPNSAVLYVSNMFFGITQYDLTKNPIARTTIYDGIADALQLGLNFTVRENDRLDLIYNPKILGLGCNLQTNAVSLLGRNRLRGLPLFMASFFHKTSFTAENLCVGSGTKFTVSANLTNITSAT